MTDRDFINEMMLAAFNSGYSDTAYFRRLIGKVSSVTGMSEADVIHKVVAGAEKYAEDLGVLYSLGALINSALTIIVDHICGKYGIAEESFEIQVNALDSHIYRRRIKGGRLRPHQYKEINNILAEF